MKICFYWKMCVWGSNWRCQLGDKHRTWNFVFWIGPIHAGRITRLQASALFNVREISTALSHILTFCLKNRSNTDLGGKKSISIIPALKTSKCVSQELIIQFNPYIWMLPLLSLCIGKILWEKMLAVNTGALKPHALLRKTAWKKKNLWDLEYGDVCSFAHFRGLTYFEIVQ